MLRFVLLTDQERKKLTYISSHMKALESQLRQSSHPAVAPISFPKRIITIIIIITVSKDDSKFQIGVK